MSVIHIHGFNTKRQGRNGINGFPNTSLSHYRRMMIFINCANPVNSPLYLDTGACLNGGKYPNVSLSIHSYVNVGGMKASDLMETCSLERMTLLPVKDYKNMSFKEIHSLLEYGFELSWHSSSCGSCSTICYIDNSYDTKCTALKILGKSTANGQDFINEVATIGRVHHTNVVQLVGFCAEGSKRALVYDFMPNGSLNNFIFSQERSVTLSWEKLLEISLGVAHGIEYLHRGCEMQILHFDIKPHNILLDEHFTPKVSDFGLARLCPANESLTSLTAAGGTIGYMAPELFYKNIGRVSYKADVYSFGMLLLEMAGRRKNLNELAARSSEIYWPCWVSDQVSNGKAMEIEDSGTEEEKKVVKKMIIVGLWCIQMNPMNRPAMNEVVEMLEGDVESLQLPPKPSLDLYEKPMNTCGELLFACLLLLLLLFQTSNCYPCAPSSCGSQTISNPFRLNSDPLNCGNPLYTLHCEKNTSTVLYLDSRKYYVQAINYDNLTIRVVDAGNSRSAYGIFTIAVQRLDYVSYPYTWFQYKKTGSRWFPKYKPLALSRMMTFINCANPVNSPLYLDTGACLNGGKYPNVSLLIHSYVNVGGMKASDLMEKCSLERMTLLPVKDYKNMSFKEIHSLLEYGFELSWHSSSCGSCSTICYVDNSYDTKCTAIKILGKSTANGQDFINEVATIGRVHHTNVVQLVGFCAERSKRALVYDFMPNGSLNNFIFSQERSVSLSWEKLLEISLGVAHGIEYLHRGCEMQILHFDIKPHNILLDKHFTPKVSDFGLARLCPANESLKSLTAARGTIGYMAPELFYKNIGRVSYKADVYSFGMLLLEMAGRRKIWKALAERSIEIYWPCWVYDQVSNEKALEIGDGGTEEEKKVVKKMIIVGLWCIPMNPMNRPAMNEVVEMLEGDVESLQLPPKPFLNLYEKPMNICGESSYMSDYSAESVSLAPLCLLASPAATLPNQQLLSLCPIFMRHDPSNCGNPLYTLHCEKNTSTVLYLDSRKYYVQAINYDNLTIRVVDAGVKKNECSSLPDFSLTYERLGNSRSAYGIFTIAVKRLDYVRYPYTWFQYKKTGSRWFPKYKPRALSRMMIFINCANPVNSPLYLDTGACLNGGKYPNVSLSIHSYVNFGGMKASDLMETCSLERMTLLPVKDYKNMSFKEIHSLLEYGFELSWHSSSCGSCSTICYVDNSYDTKCTAIKILGKSTANGQDFINEVATIGRVHHTNVVQLVGFCAERSKRALVYDFMPNGSLNNFIFSQERSVSLSWEKLLEISLGVAHGIEYLHRVSDFGLLVVLRMNLTSLTAAKRFHVYFGLLGCVLRMRLLHL
uniref:Protein kinase domain-containing protein n=1 Tax=Salix viminalis TaxID=40686 RepID=A0A6N2MQR1_SALVM